MNSKTMISETLGARENEGRKLDHKPLDLAAADRVARHIVRPLASREFLPR